MLKVFFFPFEIELQSYGSTYSMDEIHYFLLCRYVVIDNISSYDLQKMLLHLSV